MMTPTTRGPKTCAAERIYGRAEAILLSGAVCMTTKTEPGKSFGRPATSTRSASTPPAEVPTMTSLPGISQPFPRRTRRARRLLFFEEFSILPATPFY